MWRRDKGLEYWLKKKADIAGLDSGREKKETLREKLLARGLKKSILDCSLAIRSNTGRLDHTLGISADTRNGLTAMGAAVNPPDQDCLDGVENTTSIHQTILLEKAQVWPLKLPDEDNAQVHQALLAVTPYCRRFRIDIGRIPVRSPVTVQIGRPLTGGSGMLIPVNPSIKSMVSGISNLPILQKSIDLDVLSDTEKQSYLKEAEKKKGLSADKCELLAVFRYVPIEVISRLHFQDEAKSIVYSISSGLNRSRTRVYDVMVVRDDSDEIHVIPHSTRNRMVFLN